MSHCGIGCSIACHHTPYSTIELILDLVRRCRGNAWTRRHDGQAKSNGHGPTPTLAKQTVGNANLLSMCSSESRVIRRQQSGFGTSYSRALLPRFRGRRRSKLSTAIRRMPSMWWTGFSDFQGPSPFGTKKSAVQCALRVFKCMKMHKGHEIKQPSAVGGICYLDDS